MDSLHSALKSLKTDIIDKLEEEAVQGNIEEVKAIKKTLKNEQKIIHHGRRADRTVKGMLRHSKASTGNKS